MYYCYECGSATSDYCSTCRTAFCVSCATHCMFMVGKTERCTKCAYMKNRDVSPAFLLQLVCKRHKIDLDEIIEDYKSTLEFRLGSTCNQCTTCRKNETCMQLDYMFDDPLGRKRRRASVCCLCGNTQCCNECMNLACGPTVIALKRAGVPKDVRKIIWRDVRSSIKKN